MLGRLHLPLPKPKLVFFQPLYKARAHFRPILCQRQQFNSSSNSSGSNITLWSHFIHSWSHNTELTSSLDTHLPYPPNPVLTYSCNSIGDGVTGQSFNPPSGISGDNGGHVELTFAEALGLDALGPPLPQIPSQNSYFGFSHKRRAATK